MKKFKRFLIQLVQPKILTRVLCFFIAFSFIWQSFSTSKKLRKAERTSSITFTEVTRSNKAVHELSLEEPYLSRIQRIHNECLKTRKGPHVPLTKATFKYVDKIKLVMCETPKIASTTWQLALLRLSGFKNNFTAELLKKWAYSIIPNKDFRKLYWKGILFKMQHYTTFLITRHPFERLVSAYYDKLSNRSKYHSYQSRFGIAIAEKYPPKYMRQFGISFLVPGFHEDIVESDLFKSASLLDQKNIRNYFNVLKTGEVSFPQFVEYLCDYHKSNNRFRMDIHWRPQSLLCQPCLFNYSYVMKFENLNHDSNRLLEYLQTSYNLPTSLIDQVRFNKQVSPGTKNKLTEETMRLIPESQVETLRKIYRDDFRLYDYDPYLYSGH